MLAIHRETDYAIHCLKFLSVTKGRYISLMELAEATGITFTFLQKIARKLRLANIIKSSSGVNGGYVLNLPPNKISLAMIITAIEGSSFIVPCLCDEKAVISKCIKKSKGCILRSKLKTVNDRVLKIFESTKLNQL